MDIVLGVSMSPSVVRMVLLEGDNADGVTVDQDDFQVDAGGESASDHVVSAILGTRESAREGGYRLVSAGVAVPDQLQAGMLRDALAGRRVDNVALVSEFLAAAALTQTVGGSIGYARTALLFVQPDSATLAVVDSADGAITELRRVVLPAEDDAAMAELTTLAISANGLSARPGGLFVVGSGVNVGMIKSQLEVASPLPVSVPEEPEAALARGAALASAHTPLFDSSTSALAWARDPGTGMIDPELMALGYASVSGDYDATLDHQALAYSEVGGDDLDSGYLPTAGGALTSTPDDSGVDFGSAELPQDRKPLLLAGSGVAALFVIGVASLVIVLAVGIRPTAADQPAPGGHIVVPAQQVPAPEQKAPEPAAPAPAPHSALPEAPPAVQPPEPAARQVPPPAAPPPAPEAPAPAPAPIPQAPIVPVPEAPVIPIPAPEAPPPMPIPIIRPPAPAQVAPGSAVSPGAPSAATGVPAPTQAPIPKPPTRHAPKVDSGSEGVAPGNRQGSSLPSWLGGDRDGDRGGGSSWLPGGGSDRGTSPSWPGSGGDRDRDGGSSWLPGGGEKDGGSSWLPRGGDGDRDGGGGSRSGRGGFGF